MSQLDLTKPMAAPAKKQEMSFAELVRSKISTVLVGKKADDFVTSLISLMNQDVALKRCEPMSLVASALQAQSLNLSLNRQLGQAWVVSYRDNKNDRNMATFQLGYKGYVQLAIRSGNYRKLNVIAVKEGELKFFDPLNEELEIDLIQDDALREETPTTGYYAMFEYLNGFRKCLYWSKEKMQAHALRYSQAYKRDLNKGGNNSFWSKDFDAMAFKTMIRQLISKWGVMSVEMQQAMDSDMKSVKDIGSFGDVVDADVVNAEQQDVVDADYTEAASSGNATDKPKRTRPTSAEMDARRQEAADAWTATGNPLEDVEKMINCYQKNWTTAQCERVKQLAAEAVQSGAQQPAEPASPAPAAEPADESASQPQEPTTNLITYPKSGAKVDDWTCSDCDQRTGCPAWEE